MPRLEEGGHREMKTTIFSSQGDDVVHSVVERPEWRPFGMYDGEPLQRVQLFELGAVTDAEFQLVEIAAGGYFAMHASSDVAFCQVVRGRGKLGLPGGRELDYEGPELYIFHPGSLHDWHDVADDTLLSVCLVKAV
jgi:quercetin dioxygenase-like cupin family protein